MIVIKFLLAMMPIFWLMVALAGLKMPGFKACGIADLVDPVSVFCAIEEHFSMEKTASETTEAKGTTNEDKVIMHGFDVKTSFRKTK